MACSLRKDFRKPVEPDQTAYVKDGNIHEPARLIQDTCMLDYIKRSNKEGILFTIDIEKHLTQ